MPNWKIETAEHSARQKWAAEKLDKQDAVVKAANGLDEGAQQTLNEMLQNKAAVDFNRAMFDYDMASEKPLNPCLAA